ncbi:hypothetical protein Hanom_Chr14g01325071 [Helianthus anomalus]
MKRCVSRAHWITALHCTCYVEWNLSLSHTHFTFSLSIAKNNHQEQTNKQSSNTHN